jgi:hypothetical protein
MIHEVVSDSRSEGMKSNHSQKKKKKKNFQQLVLIYAVYSQRPVASFTN